MNKSTYQLNIAEPCSENWDGMTPNANGRYCNQCEKTVIDFTGKTDRQIINQLKQTEGQVCGRLLSTQIKRDIQLDSEFVRNTKWKTFGLLLSSILGTGIINGQATTNKSHQTIQTKTNEVPDTPKQTKTVNGFVKTETGEGIPFVQIGQEGTTNTVMTREDGSFSMEVPKSANKLMLKIYGMGYETKYLEVAPSFLDGQVVDLRLTSSLGNPEIVVAGYLPNLERRTIVGDIAFAVGGLVSIHAPSKKIKHKRKAAIYKLKTKVNQLLETRKKRLQKRKADRLQSKQLNKAIEIVTIEGKDNQKLAAPENPQWIQAAFPNPFGNSISVVLRSDKQEQMELVLYDELGRSLFSKEVTVDEGEQTTILDVGSLNLSAGSYFLSLLQEGEVLQTQLIIKGADR